MKGLVATLLLGSAALVACGAGAGAIGGEALDDPKLLTETSPFEFPLELWEQGVEGETVLLIHVTTNGEVDSMVVHTSSGYPAFDSAALTGADKLRFAPARQGNSEVSIWVRLPVRFLRDSARVDLNPADSP
jgi:TonB family protein